MTKREFIDRLIRAAESAKRLASSLEYVSEHLPGDMVFTLEEYDDARGARGPEGTIKFLGGKFVKPTELRALKAATAASLLWIDGKVPEWVNIAVANCSDTQTEFELMFSRNLVPADLRNVATGHKH